tara:strand:- start:398 stop:592 length:195 start_codon:yes stop_codon:yes gene_type:complete
MPYENYQEYQRDMADEAKQAALENSKQPEKSFSVRKVSGGYETWNNYEGWVHQSDYGFGDGDED